MLECGEKDLYAENDKKMRIEHISKEINCDDSNY
jgi:hypothetical protein